jgi:hypothetical protein
MEQRPDRVEWWKEVSFPVTPAQDAVGLLYRAERLQLLYCNRWRLESEQTYKPNERQFIPQITESISHRELTQVEAATWLLTHKIQLPQEHEQFIGRAAWKEAAEIVNPPAVLPPLLAGHAVLQDGLVTVVDSLLVQLRGQAVLDLWLVSKERKDALERLGTAAYEVTQLVNKLAARVSVEEPPSALVVPESAPSESVAELTTTPPTTDTPVAHTDTFIASGMLALEPLQGEITNPEALS